MNCRDGEHEHLPDFVQNGGRNLLPGAQGGAEGAGAARLNKAQLFRIELLLLILAKGVGFHLYCWDR